MTISYKHAPRAGADEKFPNADITLSDGVTTLGLRLCNAHGEHDPLAIKPQPIPTTTLRTGSGVPGYSDQEPPFTSYLQDDWSGGLGNKEFDADSTRFLEGFNIDTVKPGRVILGPKRSYDDILDSTDGPGLSDTGSVQEGGHLYGVRMATKFTPTESILVESIKLVCAKTNEEYVRPSDLKIKFFSDNAGSPGTDIGALYHLTLDPDEDWDTVLYEHNFIEPVVTRPNILLEAGTTYWIVFEGWIDSPYLVGLKVGTLAESSNSVMSSYYDGGWTLWASEGSNITMAFEITRKVDGSVIFFEYKGALYAVRNFDDGSAPKLYLNGYRGVASANNDELRIIKTGLTLTYNELDGCIVKITGGTGSTEEQNWREITSNTTGGDCAVSKDWLIPHDTTTEFVILGATNWAEITGHGLTKAVTDVLVADDIIYFAQGETVNIRRGQFYNNSGTWTARTWADDGTNKAYHLELLVNGNGRHIYKTLPSSAQIDKSEVKAWGTDLAFSGAIKCGSNNYRITNIIPYGEYGELYVVKENELGKIGEDDKYIPMPISELSSVASDRNGKAVLHHGVYLYLSLLNGYLERYYEGRLDDMGPNQGEGLPDGKEGVIADLGGYPGRFYAAVNAGKSGYSSVLCYNGTGWHPIYVSSEAGKRINRLYIQAIPGDPEQNRLWVAEETNLFALSLALDPLKDETYQFASYGYLISAWFYGGMKGLQKFWNSLSVFAENLTSGHVYTKVSYRTDTDSTWYEIGTFDTEPYEEIDCSEDDDATGRRFQYRLELFSDDASKTPQVEAVLIDAVERVPPKDGYQIRFLVEDTERDLEGKITGLSAKDIRDQLNTWRDSRLTPSPLTMRVNHPLFDNVKVFIDPAPLQPFQLITTPNIKAGGYKLIGSLSMIEV